MGNEQAVKTRRSRAERRGRESAPITTKQQIRGPRRTGGSAKRASRAAPLVESTSAAPDLTDWRFHIATLMRVSDNLVSRAIGVYDRIFALDKRDESEIYLEIGRKFVEEEKLEDALKALRRVLRTRPDHGEALFEVGAIHLRRGAPRAAIEVLRKAKAAGVKRHQLQLLLADALWREEEFAEALKEIDGALALKPALADTHYRRAMLLDRLERHAEAVTAFESAIRLAPREVRYHQSLGFTLESMGRRDDAIKCFKRALELERARDLELHQGDD